MFLLKSTYNQETMSKYTEDDLKKELETQEYEYGFYTDLGSETFPKGLSEDVIRAIFAKKNEPEWISNSVLETQIKWKKI